MNATPNDMPKNKKRTPVPPLDIPKPRPDRPQFVRKDHLTDKAFRDHPGLKALGRQLRLPNTRNK